MISVHRRAVGVGILALAATMAVALSLGPHPRVGSVIGGQGIAMADDEGLFPRTAAPIYGGNVAISRTLQIFPANHIPFAPIVKQLPYSSVTDWRQMDVPGMNPADPAWVVAVRADNLTVDDVMADYLPSDSTTAPDLRPVHGAFYVWDANSGALVGVGVLRDDGPHSYASLAAMSSSALTVVAATDMPPIESEADATETPVPTNTPPLTP